MRNSGQTAERITPPAENGRDSLLRQSGVLNENFKYSLWIMAYYTFLWLKLITFCKYLQFKSIKVSEIFRFVHKKSECRNKVGVIWDMVICYRNNTTRTCCDHKEKMFLAIISLLFLKLVVKNVFDSYRKSTVPYAISRNRFKLKTYFHTVSLRISNWSISICEHPK